MKERDKIYLGYSTLREVNDLIGNNTKNAANLNVTIKWRITNGAVIATMSQGNKVLFNKAFTYGYMHARLAQMHYEFSLVLGNMIHLRQQEDYVNRAALGGQVYDVVDEDPEQRFKNRNHSNYRPGEK